MTYPPSSSPEAASLDEPVNTVDVKPTTVKSTRSQTGLGWLAFTAVCIFWGTSSPLIHFSVQHVPPFWLVTIRFLGAGAVLWLVLSLLGRRPPLSGLPKLLPSGIALACTNILVTFGFRYAEAGAGTLLLATTAVTFAVVDICWPGGTSKPSLSIWIGLVLGLLGVAVLVFDPNAFDGKAWLGYLLLAVSAWTWAANGVAQARHPSGLDPLQSSAWQMLVAGVLVGPIAAFVGGSQLRSIPVEVWLAVAVLTVTASIVAFVSFIYMVHRLPVYVVGSYTYVNTIVAALTSVLWLGERLSPRFWVAAMLVLLGVVLIQRPSQST